MNFEIALYGEFYDGLGSAPKKQYVGIRDGLVAYIGTDPITAERLIHLPDHAISPGFIDVHTHSDVSLYLDGRGEMHEIEDPLASNGVQRIVRVDIEVVGQRVL